METAPINANRAGQLCSGNTVKDVEIYSYLEVRWIWSIVFQLQVDIATDICANSVSDSDGGCEGAACFPWGPHSARRASRGLSGRMHGHTGYILSQEIHGLSPSLYIRPVMCHKDNKPFNIFIGRLH